VPSAAAVERRHGRQQAAQLIEKAVVGRWSPWTSVVDGDMDLVLSGRSGEVQELEARGWP